MYSNSRLKTTNKQITNKHLQFEHFISLNTGSNNTIWFGLKLLKEII